jgi:hypothetical protein
MCSQGRHRLHKLCVFSQDGPFWKMAVFPKKSNVNSRYPKRYLMKLPVSVASTLFSKVALYSLFMCVYFKYIIDLAIFCHTRVFLTLALRLKIMAGVCY